MVPQTSQEGVGERAVGLCAISEEVRHSLHKSVVADLSALVGLAFQLLAAWRVQDEVSHVFIRGRRVVRWRSFARAPMCFSRWLWRVVSLEMDGCDHCVRPALNWSWGMCEV